MSIFHINEEFPSIHATCECGVGEILPHHPHSNLLLHEEFSELQYSKHLLPAILLECLRVVVLRCKLL